MIGYIVSLLSAVGLFSILVLLAKNDRKPAARLGLEPTPPPKAELPDLPPPRSKNWKYEDPAQALDRVYVCGVGGCPNQPGPLGLCSACVERFVGQPLHAGRDGWAMPFYYRFETIPGWARFIEARLTEIERELAEARAKEQAERGAP